MRPTALVVLNPRAGGGRAAARFERLQPALKERFHLTICAMPAWRGDLDRAMAAGVDCVIAAGGDGTVNAVAEALLQYDRRVPLGALGLGSSNDFHKTASRPAFGIPARIDLARVVDADVVVVDCEAPGWRARRHFLISASCGVVAWGNAFFNRQGAALRLFKRLCPDLAVLQAAAAAIARYRPVPVRLTVDGLRLGELSVATLALMKTPWLAGGLRFDTPELPASGLMTVNLVEHMPRRQLVRLLLALARGRFRGRRHTRHWKARCVELDFRSPVLLEIDGEIMTVTRAAARVLPGRMPLCC